MTILVEELKEEAATAIKRLEEASYDRSAIYRFAKAEKSWCERESREWKIWEMVVEICTPK